MGDIQKIRLNKVEVKLSDTDDPVALKISWDPLKVGGSNFKAQNMTVYPDKIVIGKSTSAVIFYSLFIIPGFLALVVGIPYNLLKGEIMLAAFLVVWGGMFFGIGMLFLLDEAKVTFDKAAGTYCISTSFKKNKSPSRQASGKLADIYALQLISEKISSSSNNGGSRTYTSYELNLVLKSGERKNVMDHGDLAGIENSAKKLAEYLNVPIWQAEY